MKLNWLLFSLLIGVSLANDSKADPVRGIWITGNVLVRDGVLLFQTTQGPQGYGGGDVVLLGAGENATRLLPTYMLAADRNLTLRLYGSFLPVSGAIPGHSGTFPNVEFNPTKVHLPADPDDPPSNQTTAVESPARETVNDSRSSFVPTYDIAGEWYTDNPAEHGPIYRHGRHVFCISNTPGYAHAFEGDYVDDRTIDGIQSRCNRSDGTVTRMRLIITMLATDSCRVDWIALDSNSDLREGQTGTDNLRKLVPPQQAPPIVSHLEESGSGN